MSDLRLMDNCSSLLDSGKSHVAAGELIQDQGCFQGGSVTEPFVTPQIKQVIAFTSVNNHLLIGTFMHPPSVEQARCKRDGGLAHLCRRLSAPREQLHAWSAHARSSAGQHSAPPQSRSSFCEYRSPHATQTLTMSTAHTHEAFQLSRVQKAQFNVPVRDLAHQTTPSPCSTSVSRALLYTCAFICPKNILKSLNSLKFEAQIVISNF